MLEIGSPSTLTHSSQRRSYDTFRNSEAKLGRVVWGQIRLWLNFVELGRHTMVTRVTHRCGRALCLLLAIALLQGVVFVPATFSSDSNQSRSLFPLESALTVSVVINEFVALNQDGLQDEDGDTSDWIELYNSGPSSVNLAGWSLTDDPALPSKWVFPAVTLPSQAYRVIFASSKDRRPTTPGSQLHTNFKLDAAGEYLALFDATQQPASTFAPQFPRQFPDTSYGRYNVTELRFFAHPTPAAPNDNASAYLGVVDDVQVSIPRGYYSGGSFDVTLQTATPGATIRYSRSGVAPSTTSGSIYTGPVNIYDTMPLRAIAYKSGYLPSPVATNSYIMPDRVIYQPANPAGYPTTWGTFGGVPTIADYEMDPQVVNDPRYLPTIQDDLKSLPALVIATDRVGVFGEYTGIYANPLQTGMDWERPVSVELINPDGSTAFQSDAGVRIHGSYSRRPDVTAKHSLRLHFRDDYGTSELNYPLFPDTQVDRFQVVVLRAIFEDAWLTGSRALYLRDQWLGDTQNAMENLGFHGRYVQVYINGLYWGMYNLVERLDDHFAAAYFGGAEEDFDIIEGGGPGLVVAEYGDTQAWNAMMDIAETNLADPAQYAAIQQYLDIPNLIDYMLIHIYAGTAGDWIYRNWSAIRKREPGNTFTFFCWDNEGTLDTLYLNNTGLGPDAPNTPAYLFWKLQANAEYRMLLADRVQRHFFNGGVFYVDPDHPAWDPAHPERNRPAARFVTRSDEIEHAIVTESARWGDWLVPASPFTRDDHWLVQRNWILNTLFPQRTGIVLQQLQDAGLYPPVDAPTFNQHGGSVPPGFQLAITAPAGTIYYTVDGSDPRIPGSGGTSPSATAYTAPFALPAGSTTVKTRTLLNTTWSALVEATFVAPQDLVHLKISEIMANPSDGSDYEFIELKNTGPLPLALSGVVFVDGIAFAFPQSATLDPGRFALLVNNATAFQLRYPGVSFAGEFTGDLANEGEHLRLADPTASPIVDMTYFNPDTGPWPACPIGFSLVLANLSGDPNLGSSWRCTTSLNGSPAQDESPIVINEVLAHSDPPLEDAIELFNPTTQSINIGGWFLSDSLAEPRKFRIPDNTTIRPGDFKVFYEYQFNPNPGVPPSFAVDATGDQVLLSSADFAGNLTGFAAAVDFDASLSAVSFGRYHAPSGVDLFPALSRHSFGVDNPSSVQEFRTGTGANNAYPSVGPVVINELMYHPPTDGDEFIELHNMTDTSIPLYGLAHPATTWRFTNGISFTFPANTTLPPRSYALVVGVNPEAFRATYTIPITVPVFGPYTGALDNAGERVTLALPDLPATGSIPYVAVDEITYDDAAPWPTDPDGNGSALERLSAPTFGNDPATWRASLPDGSPGQLNPVCFFADVHPHSSQTNPELCDNDVDIADIQTVAACWNRPLDAADCPPPLNTDGLGPYFSVGDIIATALRWDWGR